MKGAIVEDDLAAAWLSKCVPFLDDRDAAVRFLCLHQAIEDFGKKSHDAREEGTGGD